MKRRSPNGRDSGGSSSSARAEALPRLPSSTSSLLIGRQTEVLRLSELLAEASIVTIAGAGGVGKTSLAIEVARLVAASYTGGAAFVGLAHVEDPALVTAEISRTLGLVDLPGTEPTERLIAGLRSIRRLIVLDNFEHLVGAAPLLDRIVAGCPYVTLLVTSRRRLGLRAERVLELGPLALPDDDSGTELSGVASVALFCERASAVNPRFRPDRADLAAIGQICRQVDGLPLAIELVASHVRVFPPEALLARMQGPDTGLRFLHGGPVDVDSRHRDLRRTIAWSADLLRAPAARLLPRLAVFRAGWTLDAMEAVCCADLVPGADGSDAGFEALVELVDLHLVEPVPGAGADARFRLLETVRRFGLDALADEGCADEVQDRHAEFFAGFARQAGAGLETADEHEWAARIGRELPNLRAALHHFAATGRADDGLAAAVALGPYWLDRGPIREGRDLIDRFLPLATGPERLLAVATGWSIRLAIDLGLVGAVGAAEREQRLRRARDVLDREGDDIEWLRLTDQLSRLVRLEGRSSEAEDLLVDALGRCRTSETAWRRAELLLSRAVVAQSSGTGDRQQIDAYFEEATDAARRAGHERARARAVVRRVLSDVSRRRAALVRAEIEEVFQRTSDIEDRRGAAMSALVAAVLAIEEGEHDVSARWLVRCLAIGTAVGDWHVVVWSIMGATMLAARTRRFAEASRLYGATRTHLDVMRIETPPAQLAHYEQDVGRLRDGMGDKFASECGIGERRPWDETVGEARQVLLEIAGQPPGGTTTRPADAPRRRRGPRASAELSDRELDVLRALVAGMTNREVADALGISPKTVMHHTASVYRKLAVRGRAEAVACALRTGLVSS